MTNIRDVAHLAGVSVATVSRYLNQKGYLSEKSKKKIEVAINELSYKPNLIARSLSTKQDNSIGLILPDITNPFFPELARAIEDTCMKKGYSIILCNTDDSIEKETHYLQLLKQKYVAGLIITMNHLPKSVYLDLNIPIVGLDRVENLPIPIITTDNERGGMMAAEYLTQKGSKNLLILSGPAAEESVARRVQGFQQYTATLEDVNVAILPSHFNYKKSFHEVVRFLKEHPTIDGIFACSDMDGIAAIKAATSLNYSIPEEIQVIGFDGISIGELTSPSLTSVAQNIYLLGSLAAEQLIAQIEGQEVVKQSLKIAPQLVLRDSTRKE